jgi:DMSO/TMAO reductase YedYZ molybdopterin-dependent catalytic subunit
MKNDRLISRREMLISGAGGLGALLLTSCSRQLPQTYGNLLRCGDNFTYAAQRSILSDSALAREYAWKDITSFPATGTVDPGDAANKVPSPEYATLRQGGFADYKLAIEGAVARPGSFSLSELKSFPARTQITKHLCEEGWSAIAQWTGVPLSLALDTVGMLPSARFVTFYTFDDIVDSIDLVDALHPQTLLTYGMNGRDLPIQHGAPLRIRVERQLGYKSLKYVTKIVVTETLDDGGDKGAPKNGWAWFVGI